MWDAVWCSVQKCKMQKHRRLKDKDHFQIIFSGMVYILHAPSNHKQDGHELSSHQKKLSNRLGAPVPTVRALGLSGIRDPEAIADRLTYLLSASSPPGALRKLREIFRSVGSHDVRLCLRARGWLPKLLSETATLWKQASCLSAESNSSKAADFWRGGIWYSLSADCGAACDILDSPHTHVVVVNRLCNEIFCAKRSWRQQAHEECGLLKRRRSGQM
ncbi:rpoB, partial [Symbiodinium necroappetens]